MTTSEFIDKVAKVVNVQEQLICITYDFDTGDKVVEVEMEEGDSNSLHHAVNALRILNKVYCGGKTTT